MKQILLDYIIDFMQSYEDIIYEDCKVDGNKIVGTLSDDTDANFYDSYVYDMGSFLDKTANKLFKNFTVEDDYVYIEVSFEDGTKEFLAGILRTSIEAANKVPNNPNNQLFVKISVDRINKIASELAEVIDDASRNWQQSLYDYLSEELHNMLEAAGIKPRY